MADISPEERCHYASVHGGFIGQMSIWPAPRRVSPRFSRRRRLFEARPGDEASRTTANAAQFRATRIVSLVAVSVVQTFRISGCT